MAFKEDLSLMIIGLGCTQVVLRMPWLMKKIPHIDWVGKTISFTDEHIWKTTLSTKLTIAAQKDEVTLPPQYTDYIDVFCEKTFDILPLRWEFDHAINLKESFIPKIAQIYPLNPQEVDTCKDFVDKNLKTGRIRPQSHLKPPPSSLSKRRTENFTQYKITNT